MISTQDRMKVDAIPTAERARGQKSRLGSKLCFDQTSEKYSVAFHPLINFHS